MIRLLVAGTLLLATQSGAVARADDPLAVTVTSDSLAYCRDLARRLPGPDLSQQVEGTGARLGGDMPSPAPAPRIMEIERLRREGLSMCDAGFIRSGIGRLRRALMMVREPAPPSG